MNLKMYFILQCPHGTADGEETLHLFSHYIPLSETQLCLYLKEWMDTHTMFVEKVGTNILSHKGITTDNYIAMMLEIGQPLDEIGIVLVARMYHIHVAIIQDSLICTGPQDMITILHCAKLSLVGKGA